jgi:hypothetical protein
MHEFLRDNLTLKYGESKSCEKRSQFACVICGFCWSCHWKQEPYAENIPRYLLKAGGWLKHKQRQQISLLSSIEGYGNADPLNSIALRIIYLLGYISNFYNLKDGSFLLKFLPSRSAIVLCGWLVVQFRNYDMNPLRIDSLYRNLDNFQLLRLSC